MSGRADKNAAVRRILDALEKLKRSGLAGESSWGLALEVSTLFGTILSFMLLGRSLGPEGYGGYASLYAIVGPLVTLAASGVTLSLLQHVMRDGEPLEQTARSCLTLGLGLGLLLTGVGFGLALWIIDTLSVPAILSILLTEFVTMPALNLAAATVQATTGFGGAARIRIFVMVARIVVLVALFSADTLTVESFGLSMLAISSIAGVFFLNVVGREHGFTFAPGRIQWPHVKSNLSYSGGISADALGNDGDKLVLAANQLVVETGLYSAAYRVVQMGLIPVGSVIQATHGRFLQHEEGLEGQHLHRALRFAAAGAVYGIAFALGIILFAPLLPIVLGDDFEGSIQMVRWLSPLVLLRAVGSCSINGLMGLSRVTMRTILLAVNAAMAMALYVVLIPIYGWKGAVAGTLIGELTSVLMTWGALIHYQRIADRSLTSVGDSAVGGSAVSGSAVGDSAVGDLEPDGSEHPADSTEDL